MPYQPFQQTQTQILAYYVALMATFLGLSIPIFTQLVVLQVDRRIRADMQEEIEAFEEALEVEVNTGGKVSLREAFDDFLYHKIPGDKTFLITVIEGEFYRSSPLSLPETISPDSDWMERLSQTQEAITGNHKISDPEVGDIFYRAEPIDVIEKNAGVLIVANIPKGERQEVLVAVYTVTLVLLLMLIPALFVAWIASGRVLSPIRVLAQTAKSISEANLTERIAQQGGGEIADLTIAFNQMMDRLEIAFNSQRQLINDVSHELRTPIAIIQGHLESLHYYEPEEQPEVIQLVLDELCRMTRLVEDLLLLAKAEHQDFLILEEVEVTDLTEVIYLKARALENRNWILDSRGIGMINVDVQKVTQAVMNLVQNAVQHTTEKDTIAIGSSIDHSHKQSKLMLWVRDTGVGICIQDQERIFQRFVQGSNTQNCEKGMGLGLSIVAAIAESHRGSVELKSQFGRGSTFTLVLPVDVPKSCGG
ncbi:MAG: HAMP domain-containing histidine kinase [Oscillatoriales cyanobacterium RM1_1_9]|nr:HAMP domain-containing histidine kinase [Oscillatoriales cyanobacterium RM2_1_1]NJO70530.1 HAMP domain-containing histidine kinase [Oscillatoriales cyanobacterium RM1_1_9]